MELYQHIYGRVARGYRTSYSGYQLAALTDSLIDNAELIERLNRFSFFHKHDGQGSGERYSFYRPVLGYMAFGCSRLVKDPTGAVGSFCHNFVCKESDFIASGASPITLLRRLPFIRSEEELGANRSLDAYVLDTPAETADTQKWRPFALSLLDTYLGESILVFPMVVLGEDSTWDLLHEIFSLLPRLEASRFSFSTLFKGATDFIEVFRLLFVPDRKAAQGDEQVFRILEPGPESDLAALNPAPHVPFTDFWRKAPGQAPLLIRFIDTLRHSQDGLDDATLLVPDLLGINRSFGQEMPRLFREAVESLAVPHVYELLSQNSDWLRRYREGGGPLDYVRLREAVWGNPYERLIPTLNAALQMRLQDLMVSLLQDLARRVISGSVSLSLLQSLQDHDHLKSFYDVTCNYRTLSIRDIQRLAERVRDNPFYSGQYHYAVARYALLEFGGDDSNRAAQAADWITQESQNHADPFFIAVSDLFKWYSLSPKKRPAYKLSNYVLNSVQKYDLILSLAWGMTRPYELRDRIRMVSHPHHRERFITFCSDRLRGLEFSDQRDFLGVLAQEMNPYGHENAPLIEVIRRADKAHELAKFYAWQLQKLSPTDNRAIALLQDIEPPRSKWGFLRR
jgi:hypothetical protein